MEKKSVVVGMIGFGTVGAGVAKILLHKQRELDRRLNFGIKLKRIADLDIKRQRGIKLPKGMLVSDAKEVLNDPDIDIIVELIGGIRPARDFIITAAKNGKHVVTANKALLATSGDRIFSAAEKFGVEVGFEAAVAGSIPIIKVIRESLIGNRILALYGIINGTSNYILSRMTEERAELLAVLRDAQRLGYAEADPTFDIDGTDSAHKLVILLSLAFGVPFSFKSVYTEGITGITPIDIQFAAEFGYTIKLLAIAKISNQSVEARVHPTMIPGDDLMSSVNGVYNAIHVEADAVGSSLFYGKGAGEMPTGSAVVSDIADIARNIVKGAPGRMRGLGMPLGSKMSIMAIEDLQSCYYLRLSVIDKPGVLSRISGILGNCNISIKSVIQKERKKEKTVPLVMMTHRAQEKNMLRALKEINRLSSVRGKTMFIRVESKDE